MRDTYSDMVQRGIPWDELPHNYKLKYSPQLQPVQQKEIHSASSNREAGSMQYSTEKRTSDNVEVDPKAPKLELLSWDGMESVARRFAFGTLVSTEVSSYSFT